MAPVVTVSASYKKQDGSLQITKDQKLVLWTPSVPAGSAATLKIVTLDMEGLAKSPATSARVSTRIAMKAGSGPEAYVFNFSSPTARADQELIVETLKAVIQVHTLGSAAPTANAQSASSPAGGAASRGNSSNKALKDGKDAVSDAALLEDNELQQSLLQLNPALRQRFAESLQKVTTTNVLPLKQFVMQFWSPRLQLLRAHAVERNQSQGSYNVLSAIKIGRDEEGQAKLSLVKEQIQTIFDQHPLVRKVYNNLVPQSISENQFWSEFFVSRLFKKLKGEKITDMDAKFPHLDAYLDFDNDTSNRSKQFTPSYIPRVLDLEGNEQDHPETMGNVPDKTMYIPKANRQALLRVLNSMSEKMMANVAPFDKASMNAPAGMSEAEHDEFRLRDLEASNPDSRLLLNISSDQRFFSQDASARQLPRSSISPKEAIKRLRHDISTNTSTAFDFDGPAKERAAESSKAIMKSVRQRMNLMVTPSESELGLSQKILNSITMTNNTTVEFLHYFWSAYLSGDEARAAEISSLVGALQKSLERIDAVAAEAEVERSEKRQEARLRNEEYQKRTGRKMAKSKTIEGGKDAVNRLVSATQSAIQFAEMEYQKALVEQTPQATAVPS